MLDWPTQANLWQKITRGSRRQTVPLEAHRSREVSVSICQKVVAIIDDDDGMRDGLANLLAAAGYLTEAYGSGEAFIGAAMKSEAGCLVVDIHLGDITGVELGRHLLAMGLTFPFIFMTGSDDPTIRKQAMEFGCVAYLQKPFPPNQLVKAITEAIG